MFVKTDTILDKILARKVEEVDADRARLSEMIAAAQVAPPPKPFAAGLRRETVALIAEIKKASPSKGVLIEDFDPVALGEIYAVNGAAAISILTDQDFFQGHMDYLRAVRAVVATPILRKEFIVDAYQVYEGRAAGADAILLIVAALEDAHMADLHALIESLGMAALVEVHNETELERALKIGATLIGVNNRDLKTFREDLNTTGRIAKRVPPEVTLVAESAIRSLEDVQRMAELGAHAILVGEGLVKAGKIAEQVRLFSSVGRP
ncbi:MAG: indole-3-glycerol phosphate synthase TrpC [Chloroflexi bacterium]|uniref:indole-3-glycerol phosphate synthase TrpC n=1 Tax=Candidatus Flexifilum breve TaxID=3140694 RepID=UPI003135C62F|nr:indole-3-glycerol phosphate synthase TrpC [Chloroflexota bacterium]